MLPWTSMKYSMEFRGTPESPNKKSPSSMGFHGIRWAPFQMTQVFNVIQWNITWNSMELWCRQMKYHWVPWNIRWNSMELWCRQMKYHLVPWNSMDLWDCHFMTCYPGLPRDIPWNSTELWSRQIKNHRVPWDSMELGGRHFKWHKCSMEYSMELHGTLVPPNEIWLSSMEFHGALKLSF